MTLARKSGRKGKAFQRTGVSKSDWRRDVLARDGYRCRACGLRDLSGGKLSAHHVIFLSHCSDAYIVDRRNGLTLCNEWGNECHQKVHGGKLKIRRRILPPEVVTCLEEQGMFWDSDGRPYGPCSRYFAQEATA